jgi:hypothetical protein
MKETTIRHLADDRGLREALVDLVQSRPRSSWDRKRRRLGCGASRASGRRSPCDVKMPGGGPRPPAITRPRRAIALSAHDDRGSVREMIRAAPSVTS